MTTNSAIDDDLLRSAAEALRRAGQLEPDGVATLEPLAGGISNDVAVVTTAHGSVVVKRALPRLRVAEIWEASAERAFTEAAALQWAHSVLPDAVPVVVAVDRELNVILVDLAPPSYENWKVQLLRGDVRPEIGSRLGLLLASWHAASAADPAALGRFGDLDAFSQLRIMPFYEAPAARHPEVAAVVMGLVERMSRTHSVLVHGDFSPKNILLDAAPSSELWVIDWEVAHAGDPVFDLAFLLHHLVCKMIAVAEHRVALIDTAVSFLAAYRQQNTIGIDESYLAQHVAALVLARVDGKSPVEYFTPEQSAQASSHALALLSAPRLELHRVWSFSDDR